MHSNQVPVKRYTDAHYDVVTATAVDDDETEATDDDDETVGFSNVHPRSRSQRLRTLAQYLRLADMWSSHSWSRITGQRT